MRTIIAGSRCGMDYDEFKRLICPIPWVVTTIISGGARGIDALGERLAEEHGIPLEIYRADWDKHGRAAGPIRNREMASKADALIAVWDGKSKGTANMIQEAKNAGLKIAIYDMSLVQS